MSSSILVPVPFPTPTAAIATTTLIFVQDFPNLIDLGSPRMEILKYFCLPSMVGKTSIDFLWLIRTNPNLDRCLRSAMVQLLRSYPNFLFIADGCFTAYFMNDDIGGTIGGDGEGDRD